MINYEDESRGRTCIHERILSPWTSEVLVGFGFRSNDTQINEISVHSSLRYKGRINFCTWMFRPPFPPVSRRGLHEKLVIIVGVNWGWIGDRVVLLGLEIFALGDSRTCEGSKSFEGRRVKIIPDIYSHQNVILLKMTFDFRIIYKHNIAYVS